MLNYYICNANAGWEQELDLGVFSEAAQCLDDEMTSNKRNFIVEQKMFCITFHHLGPVVFIQNMIYALYNYGDSLIIYYIGRVQFTRASVIFKVSFFSFGLRLMYPLLIVIFCCI